FRSAEHSRFVLGHVLDTVLRLLHPIIPFVTERLWIALTGGESLMVADWPTSGYPGESYVDTGAAARVADVRRLITEVRRFRADQGLKPGQRVATRLSGQGADAVAVHEQAVRSLANLDEPAESFATTTALEIGLDHGPVMVELDLSGAIDVVAERARLDKDLTAAQKELEQTRSKLDNENFVNKAPAEVVEKIRTRREAAQAEIDRIHARLATLPPE